MAEHEIRSGRGDGFTVLYNSMVKDDRLPLEAKGLFAYIMSRPPDWKFTVSGLAVSTKTGKDKIRRILAQLEQVGYLLREQGHKENGTFGGNVYVLQDFAPPLSGNTDNGETRQREKPSSGFPTQINNKLIKEEKKQTPIAPAEVEKRVAEYCGGDEELREAIMGLLENRTKLNRQKTVKTERAMNGILRKLDELSGGRREMKLALLDKATTSNWLTVYELKPDEIPTVRTEGSASLPLGWGV